MTTALTTVDAPDDLKEQVSMCVAWSRLNSIVDSETFTETAEHLKKIKSAQRSADEFFDPPIRQAYELHKTLVGRKRVIVAPLLESEQLDKQAMVKFQQAEARKAEAERVRLQAEADLAARRERQALERKAAAAKRPETKEKYQEQAAQVIAPVVHVETKATPVQGIKTIKVWKARVVDESKVERQFLCVDEKKLNAYAKAMREQASSPGIEFYCEDVLAASAGF